MIRIRRLLLAGCACACWGVTAAAASLLPVSSAKLAAGAATATPCDTTGVSVSYSNSYDTTVADYRTTAVSVSNLDPDCIGRTLSVTVRAANGAALWQASATVTSSAQTLTGATPFQSSAVAGWAVSITG